MQEIEEPEEGLNWIFWIIGGGLYVALTIYFAYQTWTFVDWLFPDDQIIMKALTLISFDVMSVFWGCLDLFYKFASPGAKMWVRVSWIVTFILSSIASILYLVVESVFRFHLSVSPATLNTGYIISIIAVVYNIIALVMWVYLEYTWRHPRQDHIDYYRQFRPVKKAKKQKVLDRAPAPAALPATPLPSNILVEEQGPAEQQTEPLAASGGQLKSLPNRRSRSGK